MSSCEIIPNYENFDLLVFFCFICRSMIRYDPDEADLKRLEKQPTQNNAKEKKKKVKKKPDKNQTIEEVTENNETSKPEVSKEKHYSVTDALKDAFKKTEEKASFSLSAMFDEKIQKGKIFAIITFNSVLKIILYWSKIDDLNFFKCSGCK